MTVRCFACWGEIVDQVTEVPVFPVRRVAEDFRSPRFEDAAWIELYHPACAQQYREGQDQVEWLRPLSVRFGATAPWYRRWFLDASNIHSVRVPLLNGEFRTIPALAIRV